jgi:bacterioferritin-associated ferredoxin
MILNVATSLPMIVCLCAGVSERELAETIAGGATTVREVGRRCGAGTGCGACKPLIRECLARGRAEADVGGPVTAAPAVSLEPVGTTA